MNSANKPSPSVPSSPAIPGYGSGLGNGGAEGGKNLWKRSGCHDNSNKTTLTLACYNARTLRTDERFVEFENETQTINWDLIGLSEVRRKGEELIKLESGNLFYYKGHDDSSYGGVGFFVNKSIASKVQNIKSISTRVCYITIELNSRYSLKLIQVYAPTSSHSDEESEKFFEDINTAIINHPCHFTTIMGDFNAKVGKPLINEKSVGGFGLGLRNNRGQSLVNFTERMKLYVMNTFFQKRPAKKWTWASPDGKTKNEVDYIISSHKYVVRDITVLSRFKTGSDHRLVRATYEFNLKHERTKLITSRVKYDKTTVAQLQDKQHNEFRVELKNRFEGLEELNLDVDGLNETLCKTLSETARKHYSKINRKSSKLAPETIAMMEERREMPNNTVEEQRSLEDMNRKIKKATRFDLRKHNTKVITDTIKQFRGPKVFRRKLNPGLKQIIKLKNSDGNIDTDRQQMLRIVEEFYGDLYSTRSEESDLSDEDPRAPPTENRDPDNLPDILPWEVERALLQMKGDKSPGEDGITVELLRAGGVSVLEVLVKLFNDVMAKKKTPHTWKNAIVTIIHKKGDSSNLGNYRPISLLSQVYKIFAKVLCNRLTRLLDEGQPNEQAGFRSGFSTIDHIHTVKQLMEKCLEYNRPLCLAFIDYEKAFDTVEHWAVLNSLHRCGVDVRYVEVLKELYSSATMQVRLHTLTNPISIKRGVRQGDTISPKLFTAVLEDIMKTLAWHDTGININGSYLSHLRFADDLVLFAENPTTLQCMLQDLYNASLKVGLKMNMSKTKVMSTISGPSNSPIQVGGENLEMVDHYVYLGHVLSFGREHQSREVSRRIQLGWAAFGKLEDIFRSKDIPQCLKTRLYNQCVLPTMTYGAETWTLTQETVHKIRVAQRAMERVMLGIKLQDRVRNTEIRRRTKVKDIGTRVTELKWNWAGHVARRGDGRWCRLMTEWWPILGHRNPGRPIARWTDDIRRVAGNGWMRTARDRGEWHIQREAYAQQWAIEG